MSNTISKNFRDDQIKGVMYINGRKTLYLKEGVTNCHHNDILSDDVMNQINPVIIFLDRYEEVITKLYGGDDFEDES